jgi:hypothetical protein
MGLRGLLKYPNVEGFSQELKPRIKAGKVIEGTRCIRVYVSQKLPEQELIAKYGPKAVIPKKVWKGFRRYETDVVESGKFVAQSLTQKVRPVKPGYSLGHVKITAGTAGTIVWIDRKPYILTNNHVAANSSTTSVQRAREGEPILQPGPYDGGKFSLDDAGDTIGTLAMYIPIDEAGDNRVDAALVAPLLDSMVERPRIQGNYALQEIMTGLKGWYQGRTSGYKEVEIQDASAVVKVSYGRFTAIFTDQILFTPPSLGGDSGSVIAGFDNRAWGLVFAGSPILGVANKIPHVIEAFRTRYGVELSFTPPPPEPPPQINISKVEIRDPYGNVTSRLRKGQTFTMTITVENIGVTHLDGTQGTTIKRPDASAYKVVKEPISLAPGKKSSWLIVFTDPLDQVGTWRANIYILRDEQAPVALKDITFEVYE